MQHVNTATHKIHFEDAANTSGNDNSQQPPVSSKQNAFYEDLSRAMFAVNMLLRASNNDVEALSNKIYGSIDATKELLG